MDRVEKEMLERWGRKEEGKVSVDMVEELLHGEWILVLRDRAMLTAGRPRYHAD
jgi:hypothetical protein